MLIALLFAAFLLALSALLASVFRDGLKEGRVAALTVDEWPLLYWPVQIVMGSFSLVLLVAGLGLLGSLVLDRPRRAADAHSRTGQTRRRRDPVP